MSRLLTQIARIAVRCHDSQICSLANHKSRTSVVSTARQISTTFTNFAERKYTDKHEWVEVHDKVAKVGISNYAQDALGDVVYAELPDIGASFKQDQECGALESVKAASEIMCPLGGKVIEKNGAVESTPGLINSSCYDEGWLFKLEINDPSEVDKLMDETAYTEFLKSDPH